jgi:hypothetical protein
MTIALKSQFPAPLWCPTKDRLRLAVTRKALTWLPLQFQGLFAEGCRCGALARDQGNGRISNPNLKRKLFSEIQSWNWVQGLVGLSPCGDGVSDIAWNVRGSRVRVQFASVVAEEMD